MRLISIFIILALAACSNSVLEKKSPPISYTQQLENNPADPVLENIQRKIEKVFIGAVFTKSTQSLDKIGDTLKKAYEKKPQNILRYWLGYLDYYRAIVQFRSGNQEASKKTINQLEKRIEGMENKNEEDYALLAMAQIFSVQFKGLNTLFIGNSINENLEKAESINAENLRVWLAKGQRDCFLPKEYGGGDKAEEYLLKALDLNPQPNENAYLPSWGLAETHETLIRFYIRNENWEKAKDSYEIAIKNFPKNARIKMLGGKLIK